MKFLRLFIILICSSTLLLPALSGQIDPQFRRDSIRIEKGVSGTTEFEPFFKIINEDFDQDNRPLTSVIYSVESQSQMVPVQRQRFEYENGNTTSFLLEEWDMDQETWVPVKQEINTYEDNRLMELLRKKASNGVLVDHRKWTYAYNAAGMETGRLLQSWNSGMEIWENLSRKTITYNSAGKIETQLLERYQDDAWVNRRRRGWTWMAGGLQPMRTTTQQWSDKEQEWVNVSRKTYNMGGNGLWSGSIIEEWDASTDEWVNEIRESFNFNPGDNSSTSNLDRWEMMNWQSALRSLYNQSPDQNTALLQQWNPAAMEHENFLRYGTNFNADMLPTQSLGMQRWNPEFEDWENRNYTRRINYFWTDVNASSTNEVVEQKHCAIPNPYVSGTEIFCTIPLDQFPVFLEVSNLYGQIIHRKQVASQSMRINATLAPGLYVVRIRDAQQIYHLEKIVIAK